MLWHNDIGDYSPANPEAPNGALRASEGAGADQVARPPKWHFRGRRIIEAAFADLHRRIGLGDLYIEFVCYILYIYVTY